jgi:YfiH family protein
LNTFWPNWKQAEVKNDWIKADWPAPPNVRALSTTRSGGVSLGPWSSFNLGKRCGDDEPSVEQNRARLNRELPSPAQWLHQVHGATVVRHPGQSIREIEGDALVSFEPGRVCAVLTADCLPVFFCNRSGDRVGIAHAGWRGLANGILQATVTALEETPGELMAWLGPAIGPLAYEVGPDVAEAFPGEFPAGFTPHGDRFLLDIYALGKLKLAAAGVHAVYGGGYCTASDSERFFSYRRDGVTGRMASLLWLDNIDSEARKSA